MRAGRLRHRIAIEEPIEAQNEYGEPVETWTLALEVWASREDLAGREYFAAQQTNSEVTTRFRLRYVDGLSPKLRINDAGTIYDVHSIQDPDGRRRELILMCSRGTATATRYGVKTATSVE